MMSSGLEQRKLLALESYRLNALLTLLVQLFPTHPIHKNLKEKIQQSSSSLGDSLIEDKILSELKVQLLEKLPKNIKQKIEKIWVTLQKSHSFELHNLIAQLNHLQKKPDANYQNLLNKYSLTSKPKLSIFNEEKTELPPFKKSLKS